MDRLIDRSDCPMRHENGNCMPAGGFCTAVNDCICVALNNAFESGRSVAFEQVRRELKRFDLKKPRGDLNG